MSITQAAVHILVAVMVADVGAFAQSVPFAAQMVRVRSRSQSAAGTNVVQNQRAVARVKGIIVVKKDSLVVAKDVVVKQQGNAARAQAQTRRYAVKGILLRKRTLRKKWSMTNRMSRLGTRLSFSTYARRLMI